jgi:hypothetical protein
MTVPPRAARAGLLSLAIGALIPLATLATPAAAHAQRDQCRYYANGRWYTCRVEDERRAERARAQARARERQREQLRQQLRERDRARVLERHRVLVRRRDDYRDAFAPRRQLSLQVGALRYDQNGRETIPMAALRGEWRLTRLLRGELGGAYGFGDLPRVTPAAGAGLVQAHALAATVGVLGELPTPVVRPYAGVAAGLFGRFDERGGERFVRPTVAFPVGVRAYLSPRLALRGEVRFRFDQIPAGSSATNTEFTAGLSVGY